MKELDSVLVVIDFGSQYSHLIAKRCRALGYLSIIASPAISEEELNKLKQEKNIKGVILSGGPASIYDKDAPFFNSSLLTLPCPILGLCYGHYIMNKYYGGEVRKAAVGEYGKTTLKLNKIAEDGKASILFKGIKEDTFTVWMSHQDEVVKAGEGFINVASTLSCPLAAVENKEGRRFSIQFHPEVTDCENGSLILNNFIEYCGMQKNWSVEAILNSIITSIKEAAGGKKVVLFLSGGVDSSVCFVLLNRALGVNNVLGVHIDNGFMRQDESDNVIKAYKKMGLNNVIKVDASESFLSAIKEVINPQEKRAIIGEHFIKVMNGVCKEHNINIGDWLLAQGTLYPDIIESGGSKNAQVIKTHHNRVSGIKEMISKGLIIEPLKDLYKDEVRLIGRKLGLEESLIKRHPFPGPGLAVNVLCSNGELSSSDEKEIEIAEKGLESVVEKVKSCFCANCSASLTYSILPINSVGVQGDGRTYKRACVLTFSKQESGLYHIPKKYEKLEAASTIITNNVRGINRVVLKLWEKDDCTDKLRLQKAFCTKERLDMTRIVDKLVLDTLRKTGEYDLIFQHLTICLPYASAENRASFVLRPVSSTDVMTAHFAHLSLSTLQTIIDKVRKLDFVDSIFYDITNKPPATFCWE